MGMGLIGKKLGMTQIFGENGSAIPVTVVKTGPCFVVQKKTTETDGYNALQIGFEEMMTALMPALAGAESISGLGSGWEGASSLEMMVINNEVYNDIGRVLRGVSVDGIGLAVDLIDKVGHMGNFLAEPHTMENLRKGELRVSQLWDKRSSEEASKEGFKPIQETARDRVRKLLQVHEPEPLDRDVCREIDQVVKEAAKTLHS